MDVKKIVGTKNIYRVRVGNYRILVELEIHTLKVFPVVKKVHINKKLVISIPYYLPPLPRAVYSIYI